MTDFTYARKGLSTYLVGREPDVDTHVLLITDGRVAFGLLTSLVHATQHLPDVNVFALSPEPFGKTNRFDIISVTVSSK